MPGFCCQIQQPFPVSFAKVQQYSHLVQTTLRRRCSTVVLDIAHIDWRQIQLCRHAAKGYPTGHPPFANKAAKCLFHSPHLGQVE